MNKNDLLYVATVDYFAIQAMSSFCAEAILDSNVQDARKNLFEIYGKLTTLFENSSDRIEEACENIQVLTRLNMNCLIEFCSTQLDLEEKEDFKKEANEIVKKYCDKKGNFIFTIDAYYDIMESYWKFERNSVSRRFDNGHK